MPTVGACPPGLQRLAVAVLKAAFEDARSDKATTRDRARAWLLGDSQPLQLWAALAGVSLDQIRRAVTRAPGVARCTTAARPADGEAA